MAVREIGGSAGARAIAGVITAVAAGFLLAEPAVAAGIDGRTIRIDAPVVPTKLATTVPIASIAVLVPGDP